MPAAWGLARHGSISGSSDVGLLSLGPRPDPDSSSICGVAGKAGAKRWLSPRPPYLQTQQNQSGLRELDQHAQQLITILRLPCQAPTNVFGVQNEAQEWQTPSSNNIITKGTPGKSLDHGAGAVPQESPWVETDSPTAEACAHCSQGHLQEGACPTAAHN